jgi:hypothetical protein
MDAINIQLVEWFILMLAFAEGQLLGNDTQENDNATAASRRTHQITTILDRLLEDYDAHIRPNFGGRTNNVQQRTIYYCFLLVVSFF